MRATLQELELRKNNFYRDSYRFAMSVLLLSLLISCCLVAGVVYFVMANRQPQYYATTTTGEIIPLKTLNEPVITSQHLTRWSAIVARRAYNLTFTGYTNELARASEYFSSNAWKKYLAALHKSKLLDIIRDKKVNMNTVVSGSPIVLYSAKLHGRFTWRVQLPILVTYESASQKVQHSLEITMNISRVPVLETPEGMQVTDFYVQSRDVE